MSADVVVRVAGAGSVAHPAAGVEALRAAVAGPPARSSPTPGDGARTLPELDPRAHVGLRGMRAVSRAAGLACVAAAEALAAADGPAEAPERRGVVLGTLWGSIDPLVEFERTAVREGPHRVSPAQFPNVVVNVHAGHLGILFALRGPNVTLCGPAAGLEAIGHAHDLLVLGRADAILCGGADDASPATLAAHAAGGGSAPAGEGAGLLVLARDGGRGARVVGWASAPPGEPPGSAAARALAAAGLTAGDVDVTWTAEELARSIGDCRAATGALAAVLAAADAAEGRTALVTASPPGAEHVAVVFAGDDAAG